MHLGPADVHCNPQIFTTVPKVVSSTKHTVIQIEGRHFMEHCRFTESSLNEGKNNPSAIHTAELEVMVGDVICPASRILNDGTIFAVCPPCPLPPGVDKYGVFEDTFEDCLMSRYESIVVKINLPNGVIMRLDAPNCRMSNNDPWINNLPNVEYSFPDQDSDEEPLLNDEDATLIELLDKEVAAYTKQVQTSSALPEHKFVSNGEESEKVLDQMLCLMKNAELASDAVLMEDMHLTMSVPELAGPVRGFGTENITLTIEALESSCHMTGTIPLSILELWYIHDS